jgi:uncharacterized protein YndB with AHSA1/START domain
MTDASEFGEVTVDGDRASVRFERRYAATRDEVWEALTSGERLQRWLGEVVEVDPRIGGRLYVRWAGGAEMHGTITALVPREVLELAWTEEGLPDSTLRVTLRDDRDGCVLRLDHESVPAESARGFGAGWHSHLDALGGELAGKDPLDTEARYEELRPRYEART